VVVQASAQVPAPALATVLGQALGQEQGTVLVPLKVPASGSVRVLDPEQVAASNCNLQDRDRRNSAQGATVRGWATEKELAKAQGQAQVEDMNQPRDTRCRCRPGPTC
jgi:hypothetical protein